MKISFCIGNGESRKNYPIKKLKKFGSLYGCNAIYRDATMDHLICCDRKMAMETVQKEYSGKVYTREDWYSFFPYDNFHKLAKLPWTETEKWTQSFHMGSGLHAVNLALQHGSEIIVLIGHDFWGTSNNKHNNVYKGTNNYWDKDHHAIDPSFWIKQFVKFAKMYSDVQFVFCYPNVKTYKKPVGWDSDTMPNVQFQELNELVDALDFTQR